MTDYFKRLATRALGREPVVQPLLPSRYGPGLEVVTPGHEPVAEEAVAEAGTVSPMVELRPKESSPSPLSAPADSPPAVSRRPAVARGGRSKQGGQAQPSTSLPEAMATVEKPIAFETPISRLPSERSSEPMVAETMENGFGETERTSADAPEGTPARLAAPQIQAGGGLASAGREFAHEVLSQVSPAPAPGEFAAADDKEMPNGSRSRVLAGSGRARASLLRETDPARSAVASETTGMKGQYPALAPVPPETSPTVAPLQPERVAAVRAPVDLSPARPATARPLPEEPEPSIAGPDIRVTIGRVEVRAVPPPSPAPRRSSPAGPRLSLEDYLKKFAGRGR